MNEKSTFEHPILMARKDGILTLTLNKPDAMNAVDQEMAAEMGRISEHLRADTESRVILLKGNGPAFMAGADLHAFSNQDETMPELIADIMGGFHSLIGALSNAPQPTVAAVHGAAAGGGLSLALACDFVLAAQDTKLALAYKRLGTSPDGGCTFSLPRIVGYKRALELLLLSNQITPEHALEVGLISRVVPREMLEKETDHILHALKQNSPKATARTKALLKDSLHRDLEDQLVAEQKSFIACASEPDFMEGVNAFLGKRKPQFIGEV